MKKTWLGRWPRLRFGQVVHGACRRRPVGGRLAHQGRLFGRQEGGEDQVRFAFVATAQQAAEQGAAALSASKSSR